MGCSLLTARRTLARALDDLEVYAISSATMSTLTIAALVNLTAGASANRFGGRWLYTTTGTGVGQQRVVRNGSYQPTSGQLTPDPTFSTAPNGGLHSAELSALFPAIATHLGADTDYRTLINRALALLLIPDRVSVAITTSDVYPLTQTWLDRPERLVSVLEPPIISGARPMSSAWRGWRLVNDGQTPTLEFRTPFTTASGNLTLEALRPADTWIRVSGVWGESTAGLVNDDDETAANVEDVVTASLMLAYQALMHRSPGRPNGNWAARYTQQQAAVRALRYYDRSREVQAAPAAPDGEAA